MIDAVADDFGAAESVNLAILAAFQKGLISATSLLTNLPGFQHALSLIREFRLQDRVGLHLNLSSGEPLSAPIRTSRRFCTSAGHFRGRSRIYYLSRCEVRAVEIEFEHQIRRCLSEGVRPTHIDSHYHIHNEWPIGTLTIRLAQRHGISRVRIARNCGPELGLLKSAYKTAFNARLRRHGLAGSKFFGSAPDVATVLNSTSGPIEMMVHPQFNEAGLLCDSQTGLDLLRVYSELGLPPFAFR